MAVASLAGVGLLMFVIARRDAQRADFTIPGEGARITAEVLNGTNVDGLARTITRRLRGRGIDVIYFGTAFDSTLDSTVVLIRRGDSSAALAVRAALGTGIVRDQPDPRLLVDVTVILRLDAAALVGLHP